MEEKFIKWILGIALFYAIFILIWKRFWNHTNPPDPPRDDKKH